MQQQLTMYVCLTLACSDYGRQVIILEMTNSDSEAAGGSSAVAPRIAQVLPNITRNETELE